MELPPQVYVAPPRRKLPKPSSLQLESFKALTPAQKREHNLFVRRNKGSINPVHYLAHLLPPDEANALYHRENIQKMRDRNPDIYAGVPRLEGTGKIKKVKNQPLYEVKFYTKTRKEAKDAIAMHGGMYGGVLGEPNAPPPAPPPLTLRQRLMAEMNAGQHPAAVRFQYLERLVGLVNGYEPAVARLTQDLQGLVTPAQLENMRQTLQTHFNAP